MPIFDFDEFQLISKKDVEVELKNFYKEYKQHEEKDDKVINTIAKKHIQSLLKGIKISIDRFIKIPEQFKYAAQLNHIDGVLTYEKKLNIISVPISEEDKVIYIEAIE